MYWLKSLNRPGRDDAFRPCLEIIMISHPRLSRAGQFTPDGGFAELNDYAHEQLVQQIVACAARPYDPARPEHYELHPPALALDLLLELCSYSTYITGIARKLRVFEPLAVALFAHVRRAEDAVIGCRQAMRTSVIHGFILVHGVLLNAVEMLDERAANWSGQANPFALIAMWCGALFDDEEERRCTCIKERQIYFLGSARKAMAAADEGDGLPSSHTSALALAIPQAVRALTTADKAAAADLRRRQMLHAWLDLALVAGITVNPVGYFCCGCGAAGARFRCDKCRSAVCALALRGRV